MRIDIDFWESFYKTAEREETSHHTLVVSEEKEVDSLFVLMIGCRISAIL